MQTQSSPELVLGSKFQAAKERAQLIARGTHLISGPPSDNRQFIMTEDTAHNYDDSSSQAGNCVGASQAEVSMGRRLAWYPFKCFQAAMEVYIGEGMARKAKAVQTRPKEPEQKNMKAN